jgi:hypothetical protein
MKTTLRFSALLGLFLAQSTLAHGSLILISDNRSTSASASAVARGPDPDYAIEDSEAVSDSAVPSAAFAPFSAAHDLTAYAEFAATGSARAQASQQSTITESGFEFIGTAEVRAVTDYEYAGGGALGGASSSATASTIFDVTFQLLEPHRFIVENFYLNNEAYFSELVFTELGGAVLVLSDESPRSLSGVMPAGVWRAVLDFSLSAVANKYDWGDFHGSVGVNMQFTPVPDGGSTFALALLGCFGFALLRRR